MTRCIMQIALSYIWTSYNRKRKISQIIKSFTNVTVFTVVTVTELCLDLNLTCGEQALKPVPFSDTSLITSSHILYAMCTGFSDGKGRVKKIILWSSENNNYTCSFSRSSCSQIIFKTKKRNYNTVYNYLSSSINTFWMSFIYPNQTDCRLS